MIRANHNQKGQSMVSMVIMLTAFLLAMLAVITRFQTVIKEQNWLNKYREGSLAAAQAGFNDAQAWFQSNNPTNNHSSFELTSPCVDYTYSHYPDYGFMPHFDPITKNSDTDCAGNTWDVRYDSGNTLASAIIREVPANYVGSTTFQNNTWIRYVIKRQVLKNWSLCGNSLSAFTDPEAVHDISASKGQDLGSAIVWAVTSKAYVYRSLTKLGGANDILTNSGYANNLTYPACNNPQYFFNRDILQPPNRIWPDGKKLLLSQATFYSELVCTPWWCQPVAIHVSDGSQVSLGGYTTLTGQKVGGTQLGWASTWKSANVNTGGTNNTFDATYKTIVASDAPALGINFKGFNKNDLANLAEKKNSMGSNGTSLFPDRCSTSFDSIATAGTFYYINGDITFLAKTAPSTCPDFALKGTGLLFVDGNLVVSANADAAWSGVVWVNGNATLNAPCEFTGTLICTGKVTLIGSSSYGRSSVIYNEDAIAAALPFFKNFRANKATIQWTSK